MEMRMKKGIGLVFLSIKKKIKRIAVKRDGVTLLELTIALAILGLVLVLVSQVLQNSFRNFRDEDNSIEYRHQARTALSKIVEVLGRARDESFGITLEYDEDNKFFYTYPYRNNVVFDLNEKDENSSRAGIWLKSEGQYKQLWARDGDDIDGYMVSDFIWDIQIDDDGDELFKIKLTIGKYENDSYELKKERIIRR